MKYHKLIAKTDKNDVNVGLPLWMHLKDTMGIALKLAEEWVPESVFKATGMDSETFKKTAVFLAGIHDIGKAASYFQSVITRECGEQRDILTREGFVVPARAGVIPSLSARAEFYASGSRASGGDPEK